MLTGLLAGYKIVAIHTRTGSVQSHVYPRVILRHFDWRPHPPSLLSEADRAAMEENLSELSATFAEQDRQQRLADTKDAITRRKLLLRDYDKILERSRPAAAGFDYVLGMLATAYGVADDEEVQEFEEVLDIFLRSEDGPL